MTYTLFCAPDTYALCAHALLEEVGVAYQIQWVTLFAEEMDPAFIAASPHGRVPALTGPEGAVFETGAVALYLAERHGPEFTLPPGDPGRALFLQWFHYLASTLQPEVLIQFHPEFYMETAEDKARLQAASMRRLEQIFDTLERALGETSYLCGDRVTVPDFILALQTVWDVIFPEGDITRYPHLARHRAALCARPAVQRVLAQHAAKRASA